MISAELIYVNKGTCDVFDSLGVGYNPTDIRNFIEQFLFLQIFLLFNHVIELLFNS